MCIAACKKRVIDKSRLAKGQRKNNNNKTEKKPDDITKKKKIKKLSWTMVLLTTVVYARRPVACLGSIDDPTTGLIRLDGPDVGRYLVELKPTT